MKTSVLLLALALAACTETLAPNKTGFGAQYQVAAEPPPSVSGSSLIVTLQYGGCNGGHDFQLITRMHDLDAEVWLKKRTPDQTCDMLIIEDRAFELAFPVSVAQHLTLFAPNGNFTLR